MDLYGCELWNIGSKYIVEMHTAWRIVMRKIWKLHPRFHNNMICNIRTNFTHSLEKRHISSIYNALHHPNDDETKLFGFRGIHSYNVSQIGLTMFCYSMHLTVCDIMNCLQCWLNQMYLRLLLDLCFLSIQINPCVYDEKAVYQTISVLATE